MQKKHLKEGYSGLLKAGKSILNTFSPELKQAGKAGFNKLARKGIKKFGKKNLKRAWNATKKIASNKEVQNLAKDGITKAADWAKDKFSRRPQQTEQEALVESFSKIVDNSLNEAWGLLAKGALTAGKAGLKGTAKTLGKQGLKGIGKMSGKRLAANIGTAMMDDIKQAGKDAYDATAIGAIHNTFKDDKGNWSFNPMRAIKKQAKGIVKTADNVFTGGIGQMAYDAVAGDDKKEEACETPTKKVKKRKK